MKISNFWKEHPKCGAKCGKGLKVWCSYYIKMGVKSVVRGKLLNKKCGAKWGKIYYIKVWCKLNLYSKKCIVLLEKNVKLSEGKSVAHNVWITSKIFKDRAIYP